MASYEEIDVEAASRLLDRYRVVDVREESEWHGPLGRVVGSEWVPLSRIRDEAAGLSGRPLLLVCRSGNRSGKACAALAECGVPDTTNLAGGMIAWNEAGLPVERSAIETLDQLVEAIAVWLAQATGTDRNVACITLDRHLLRAGASYGAPRAAAVDRALESLASLLESSGPPSDLGPCVDAFRRDLAVL